MLARDLEKVHSLPTAHHVRSAFTVASMPPCASPPVLQAAHALEPHTTELLGRVAMVHGGELAGLECRFKSRASLTRKVQLVARTPRDHPPREPRPPLPNNRAAWGCSLL